MSGGGHPNRFDTEEALAAVLSDAVQDQDFPQYGYGVVQAAALASRLRIPAISVLELGVAGGNGLLSLQGLAGAHSDERTQIEVYGFDLGSGMPPPVDYRDTPYIWQKGFFRMAESDLRSRLVDAQLVLGDIAETGPRFMVSEAPPIGFISFDLDFYSSTAAAMGALLGGPTERYLPRVICYFDDTVGPHHEMHSRFTGELLAIAEFNAANVNRKIAEVRGLRYKIAPHDGPWVPGMYVLHLFDHPRYNDYIYPAADRQFPLTETST